MSLLKIPIKYRQYNSTDGILKLNHLFSSNNVGITCAIEFKKNFLKTSHN